MPAPLDDIRVVDLGGELGAYCGRLLADLGADVMLVEPPGGSPARTSAPLIDVGRGERMGAELAFTSAGKRSLAVDLETEAGRGWLDELLSTADIAITGEGPAALAARGLEPGRLVQRHRNLIVVAISPFGLTGPWRDRPASDLTLLAAGGLLALAGEPGEPPVRPFGRQSAMAASLHACVAALMALEARDAGAGGQVVDVSVQEAVAHSVENAAQFFDLEGVVRERVGSQELEAGTGLYGCRDGQIYLMTGLGGALLGWDACLEWLRANGAAGTDELATDRWRESAWRRSDEAKARFRRIFEDFAAEHGKFELYESGQRHGVNLCPLCELEDVLGNPQLRARGYFRAPAGGPVVLPGPPYRFSDADVGPRGGPPLVGERQAVAR